MPITTIPPSSARATAKVATPKPRAETAAPQKKRRVIRRRGRARGELDSDDDIEREAATDSDSEDEDLSSLDSADDSDTEPASMEDVIPHDRAHLPTPRNSQSPDSVSKAETNRINGGVTSFFSTAGDWSEMVTDEKDNGPADLPVIEFADFTGPPAPARKPKKASKSIRESESRATPAKPIASAAKPVDEAAQSPVTEQQILPSQPPRSSGQSARLAYQHKLETDPSFVPTIGNFWGHDDRLIDTELRSLSGWWRGRGKGRGRGFLRGRGGFQGSQSRAAADPEEALPPKEVPPIERAWTHDGFEDMKRKEEQHRAEQLSARNDQTSPKRGAFAGGRGGFVPGRGRGGFIRGGFSSPGRPRNASLFSQPGRFRFTMKPEATWTKQHEAFLYFDHALKPRAGQGPGFRVKLPGQQPQVIRASPSSAPIHPRASTSKVATEGFDADRYFIVRLPKRAGKEREVLPEKVDETPIEEVFTVRPELAAGKPLIVSESTPVAITTVETVISAPTANVEALPEATVREQLEQLTMEPQPSDPDRLAITEQAVLRQPTKDVASDDQPAEDSVSAERPALAPLQTAFSPPPLQPVVQPSPAYGSPYGYHPALPPGLGMNQHGMPYELATGRPVYLQPPTMYNPRPMMPSHFTPSMTFVPGHMHHPSASAVSPDFLSQTSNTPPMNGFIDPATGTPIFSFPRQTSRIEIRAPTEESERSAKASRTSSGLRTTAPTFQPSRLVANSDSNFFQPLSTEAGPPSYDSMNGHGSMEDPNMAGMMYPPYQQTYYYPEPYYPPYMDMSQGGQYDMYAVDQPPQGTVYY